MVALNAVVYNEIHRIADLIKSASWATEIVIVDQQSTDGTWEWLKDNEHGMMLTVVQDKHWGYCEPSRKLAWQQTKSEWIGVLDADEEFSDEFVIEMDDIINSKITNVRLKRSFWLGGEHRFTGDCQHRFFRRNKVRFLDEIHTDPQTLGESHLYTPNYIGIWHRKSWTEQIQDEENYEQILTTKKNIPGKDAKLALNVHIKLLRELGITAEEADAMTIEERLERGIGNAYNSIGTSTEVDEQAPA